MTKWTMTVGGKRYWTIVKHVFAPSTLSAALSYNCFTHCHQTGKTNIIISSQRYRAILISKGSPPFRKVQFFWTLFKRGGGGGVGQPMFKNYVGNCRVFWRSFNNMKFAWKGTFEALMVKFGGKIGTLYQIFTPCTPLPKYKRAFTWFLGGSNSLPGCRRIFYRGLP